ncbi:MAG: phage tail tube protein [Armatimonadota bacterium]
MAVALAQEGAFGFGVQAAQGTYVAPEVWLPLMGGGRGDSITWRKNYVTLDMADGNDFESRYFGVGEWAEGQITVPLVPGAITSLLSWVQDRDQDNQGKWASLLVDCVHEVKKVTDAKVRRLTLDLVKGKPATCTLDVAGLKMESGTAAAVNMPTAAPYLYREATVEIASGGGTLEADANCEQIRIVIENMVEDPAEGLRLAEGTSPKHLYNLCGVRCRGAISRDFVDTALYGDFAAGQEAALRIQLTRGASTATVSLPRVLYTESDLGLPGSHEKRIVETVQFVALGSLDGLTAPVVLS